MTINFGIFIYKNDFKNKSSSNIGDYIQSLAAINIYKKIVEKTKNTTYNIRDFLNLIFENKIEGFNFIFIKRDNLHNLEQYKSHKNIITIMNGWWMHSYNSNNDISFNIPDNITPIFVSFHISNEKLYETKYIEQFKKYEPIGCRDIHTTTTLRKYGVKTYFSGCLTTTIDFYKWKKINNNTYCVDTKLNNSNDIKINHANHKWTKLHYIKIFDDALNILKKYKDCNKVYTSRLHCYLPCMAIGVPVTIVSPSGDKNKNSWGSSGRFGGLKELNHDKNKFNKLRKNLTQNVLSQINNIL
jgi:hypothetical protein